MQEWIIAMLVISLLLIFRDMAKTILTGQMSKKEEPFAPGESHPQKEKVERYAASFQKLADTFYGMPYRKEYLSSGQIDAILKDTNEEMCSRCYHREICWGENSGSLKQGGEAMIRHICLRCDFLCVPVPYRHTSTACRNCCRKRHCQNCFFHL